MVYEIFCFARLWSVRIDAFSWSLQKAKPKKSTSHQKMSVMAVAAGPCGFHLVQRGQELAGVIQASLVILGHLL